MTKNEKIIMLIMRGFIYMWIAMPFAIGIFAICGLVYVINEYKDKKFYKEAKLIELKMDDDGQYHFTVEYKSGEVRAYHDRYDVYVYRNTLHPMTATIPFKWWHTVNGDGEGEFMAGDERSAIIYIPKDYKIQTFVD